MDKKIFSNWFERFGQGWEKLDPDIVLKLFSEDVLYYENGFESVNGKAKVRELWEVVPSNQKDVVFKFDILFNEADKCAVHWEVNRLRLPGFDKESLDGVFVITLNKDGLCTEFRQWRAVQS